MRISDWSSDVCSSDLATRIAPTSMPDTRLGDLPEDVRVYLRPTGFIDAPFGHDGKALRLAGGLLWFSAIELIAAQGDKRILSELVPVERLEAALAELAAGPRASAESTLARLKIGRASWRERGGQEGEN